MADEALSFSRRTCDSSSAIRACADVKSVYDDDVLSGMGGGKSQPQLGQLDAVGSGSAILKTTVEVILAP